MSMNPSKAIYLDTLVPGAYYETYDNQTSTSRFVAMIELVDS